MERPPASPPRINLVARADLAAELRRVARLLPGLAVNVVASKAIALGLPLYERELRERCARIAGDELTDGELEALADLDGAKGGAS